MQIINTTEEMEGNVMTQKEIKKRENQAQTLDVTQVLEVGRT
jgi:hypothetical protein